MAFALDPRPSCDRSCTINPLCRSDLPCSACFGGDRLFSALHHLAAIRHWIDAKVSTSLRDTALWLRVVIPGSELCSGEDRCGSVEQGHARVAHTFDRLEFAVTDFKEIKRATKLLGVGRALPHGRNCFCRSRRRMDDAKRLREDQN